jgi:REP element-mobilizing transposase RayT
MPDHLHLLVEGLTPRSDLRQFVKMAKQRSGGLYSRRNRRRLWQGGYFDYVLREIDDPAQIAKYLVSNAVWAGLVQIRSEYCSAGAVLNCPP